MGDTRQVALNLRINALRDMPAFSAKVSRVQSVAGEAWIA
jgi:hypothetical protein